MMNVVFNARDSQGHRSGGRSAPQILAVGSIAARALSRSGGRAEPLAAFPEAPYLRAGDEIVWIGVRPRSMHPRMLALAESCARGDTFDVSCLAPVPDHQHRLDAVTIRRLIAGATELLDRLEEVGTPRGFGLLLVGRTPAFPLDLAAPIVRRFMTAMTSNDMASIEASAIRLLGLGSGLTPSGDDLVGGALFARKLVAPADLAWQTLGERLITIAPSRTHDISAALLADLIHGATYGVLHTLVDALADNRPFAEIVDAARALTAIGHSSGWDMLTGFFYALEICANECADS